MIRLAILARRCGLNLNYAFAPCLAWQRNERILITSK